MEKNGGKCCHIMPAVSYSQFHDQGNNKMSLETFCRARLPSMDQFSIIDKNKGMCCA
jgi:hypothetical protein